MASTWALDAFIAFTQFCISGLRGRLEPIPKSASMHKSKGLIWLSHKVGSSWES